MRELVERDVASVERRERHLWLLVLALLFFLALVTIVTLATLVDSGPIAPRDRRTALVGALVLIALFCAYALDAHASFGKIRRMYGRRALEDPLTGLQSRQSFWDRFDEEVSWAGPKQRALAVILCDLDDFGRINDSYGHDVGDRILRRVANGTLTATRGSDLVFRWGGDEILVLANIASREGALIVAQRIRDNVRAVGHGEGLDLDLSVGIAFYPEHTTEAKELIRLANRALFIARQGGEGIHVGEEEYELDEHSVDTVFQPVVTIGSRDVMGYEALSRDPKGEESIGRVFERYRVVGQLAELKRIIFRHQVRSAWELGLPKVFVNIDFQTLRDVEPFPKPEGLEVVLELSEAESVDDVDRHLATAARWKELGYKFAIDDFGAGFMSLPFIARLVPEYIKVDRSTVLEATSSARFSRFLRDLVAAMRNYSTDGIIAEGIETEDEFEVVKAMGVDQVQGYLTGRPAPLDGRAAGTNAV